jgi:hypothetical protein
MKLEIGDKVRVHYHPANPRRSFVEGVVRRIDVPTLRGRVFVIDVTYEVVFDREQPVRPGYQNYVLYERRDEFQGRIEVLSGAEVELPSFPEPLREQMAALEDELVEAKPATEQAIEPETERTSTPDQEQELKAPPADAPEPGPDLEVGVADLSAAGREPRPEPESEPFEVEVERQGSSKRSNPLADLFRRGRSRP